MARKRLVSAIEVVGDLAYVDLGGGFRAVIDFEDVPLVQGLRWHRVPAPTTDYAAFKPTTVEGRKDRRDASLHRRIMRAAPGVLIDHEDGDGLNCRKSNLREATETQNRSNTRRRSDNRTGFKGVSPHRGQFRARIHVAGKERLIGVFSTAEEAARRYDEEAIKAFGAFARTNGMMRA